MALELLAASASDPAQRKVARRRGWDAKSAGISELTELVRIKNLFQHPTSGGWSDCMLSFRFADDQAHGHVCEVQFVHADLMLVRKHMGAHNEYAQFRSAMELLLATGQGRLVAQIDMEEDAALEASEAADWDGGGGGASNGGDGTAIRALVEENARLRKELTDLAEVVAEHGKLIAALMASRAGGRTGSSGSASTQ
jgi:hypothetical protein